MISKIFHFADIHIRKGNVIDSRFTEYDAVIDETICMLNKLYVPDESLCVVCGDIFHHKLQISSHGIVLFNKFITKIANLMPIIIIQGNHDLIQENDDTNNDLIQALLTNIDHPNIHYFDSSGSYAWDDEIQFGLVNIRDMLESHTGSGLVESLPEFPPPVAGKLNIALSHATIKGFQLNKYKKAHHGVPLEWFEGYDLLLLGDIHLQSAKYNTKQEMYYGYPGSLIQQDFGEPMFNHGFLVWNISALKVDGVDKYHVLNTIARGNLRLINDQIHINSYNTYESIETFLKHRNKPTELNLRLWTNDDAHKNTLRNDLIETFKSHGMNARIDITTCNGLDEHTENNEESVFDINFNSLNSTDTLVEFFKSTDNATVLTDFPDWERYIRNIDNVKLKCTDMQSFALPSDIQSKIDKKNDKFGDKIETIGSRTNTPYVHNVLRIMNIQFDWILPFGKHNQFVFKDNTITLINAPNGVGKSAFFECIVLGLFGTTIPSRSNKSTSLSILNKRRPSHDTASNISIEFSINNRMYRIKRDFLEYSAKQSNGVKRLHSNNVLLYENDSLIKSGARLVNSWVETNLCTLKDFLLSTMITQNFDNDFFKLRESEQNELLDSVLNMKAINNMFEIFKEAKKEYKDLKNHTDTFINAIKPTHPFDEEEYSRIKDSCATIESQLEVHTNLYDSIDTTLPKSLRLLDDLVKPSEPLNEILSKEIELTKQLNVLNLHETFYESQFDLMDIEECHLVDDALIETGEKYGIIASRITSPLSQKELHASSLRQCIIKARTANDAFERAEDMLNHTRLTQPDSDINPDNVEQLKDEYNAFDKEFSACKKKYKKLTDVSVLDPPDFDVDNVLAPTVSDHLIDLPDDELTNIANKKIETNLTSVDYSYNHDCWACRKNFNTNESNEAGALLLYREQSRYLEKWTKYLKNKVLIDTYTQLYERYTQWNQTLSELKRIETWKHDMDVARNNTKNAVRNMIELQQTCVDVFQHQQKCNQAFAIKQQLDKVLLGKRYYINEKLRAKYAKDALSNDLIRTKTKLAQLDVARDQEIEYNNQKVRLKDLLHILDQRTTLFNHFTDTLVRYKSWIYNEKLLPAIVNKTNQIVNNLFHHRKLKLCFSYVDNSVVFTVIDEGNTVHMEKLSGAQAFAVSLSFRLALSAVGITKFRCNQLFIDEGFCSFDQHNLLNVPGLMRNLKTLFNEILLVTHLDEIKACADKVVNIDREYGISTLKYH